MIRRREHLGIQGILRVFRVESNVNRLLNADEMRQAIGEGDARMIDETHNLVVDIGLQAIAKFLGNNLNAPTVGGSTFSELADITIAAMELGTTVSPADPDVSDTLGVGTLVYSPALVFTYPTSFSIRVSGVVPVGEANGLTITEEALKLANGMLFAAATGEWEKTEDYALQFDHTLTFARA